MCAFQNPFLQNRKSSTAPSHSSEWEEYQRKTIREFFEAHLSSQLSAVKKDSPELNFAKDFKTGDLLNSLVDIIVDLNQKVKGEGSAPVSNSNSAPAPTSQGLKPTGAPSLKTGLPRTSFKRSVSNSAGPTNRVSGAFASMYHRDNVQKAFQRIRTNLGVKLNNIDAEDIVQGNSKMTQALLWKLIRHYDDLTGKWDIEKSVEEINIHMIKTNSRRASLNNDETPQPPEGGKQQEKADEQKPEQKTPADSKKPTAQKSEPVKPSENPSATTNAKNNNSSTKENSSTKNSSTRNNLDKLPNELFLDVNKTPREVAHGSTSTSPRTSPRKPDDKDSPSTSASDSSHLEMLQTRRISASFSLPSPVPEEENPRDNIAREIFTTELTYTQHLSYLTKNYLPTLKPFMSVQEQKTVFSNIAVIEGFCKNFLEELKARVNAEDKIVGDVFLKYVPFFKKSYSAYCSGNEESCALTKQMMKKPEFETAALGQKKASGGLDLESLLITPVQRIPRYKLLLVELLKHTPEEHPDHKNVKLALEQISEMALAVNASVIEGQRNKQRDNVVQLYPEIHNYITPTRKYQKEIPKATFQGHDTSKSKSSKVHEGFILVFSDMIFLMHKKKVISAVDLATVYNPSIAKETLTFVTPTHEYSIKAVSDLQYLLTIAEEAIKHYSIAKAKKTGFRKFHFRYPDGRKYDGDWKLTEPVQEGHGVMKFEHGGVYDGEWVGGRFHGQGTMTYASKSVYEGAWENGNRSGKGTFTFDRHKYIGEWKNDQKHGKGSLQWANGDTFDGNFARDKIEGVGTLKTLTGFVYKGEWAENMMDGRGELTYPDGRLYSGEFGRDKRHGKGTLTFPNGSVFDGKWSANLAQGEGTMKLLHSDPSIQSVYVGNWVRGKRSGSGTLTISKQDTVHLKYSGEWANDMFNGKGELEWNNTKFVGDFVDNNRVGQGTWTDCTGSLTGQWKANMPTGQCTRTFGNTNKMEGSFAAGLHTGISTLVPISSGNSNDRKTSHPIVIDNRLNPQNSGLLIPINASIALLPMTTYLL